MKQLYFYNNEGTIYFNTPYVESYNTMGVEVPEGKRLVGFDMKKEPAVPIFEDLPLSETSLLESRIESLELALAEALGGK